MESFLKGLIYVTSVFLVKSNRSVLSFPRVVQSGTIQHYYDMKVKCFFLLVCFGRTNGCDVSLGADVYLLSLSPFLLSPFFLSPVPSHEAFSQAGKHDRITAHPVRGMTEARMSPPRPCNNLIIYVLLCSFCFGFEYE